MMEGSIKNYLSQNPQKSYLFLAIRKVFNLNLVRHLLGLLQGNLLIFKLPILA